MRYCPDCSTANRDGSPFCNGCGQRLPDAPADHAHAPAPIAQHERSLADQATAIARSNQRPAVLTIDDLDVIAWYSAFDEEPAEAELTDDDLDAVTWLQAEPSSVVETPASPAAPPAAVPVTPSVPDDSSPATLITNDGIALVPAEDVATPAPSEPAVEPAASLNSVPAEPAMSAPTEAVAAESQSAAPPAPHRPPQFTLPDWLEAAEPDLEPTVPASIGRSTIDLPEWLFLEEPERAAQPLPEWLFLREPWEATPASVASPAEPAASPAPTDTPPDASDSLPSWLFLEEVSEAATTPEPSWREELAAAIAPSPAPADSPVPPPAAPEESLEYDYGGAWSMVRRLRELLAEQERIAAAQAAALAAGQPLPDEIEAIVQTSIDGAQSNGHTVPTAEPLPSRQSEPVAQPNRRGPFGRGGASARADATTAQQAKSGRKRTGESGIQSPGAPDTTRRTRRGLFGLFGRKR